MSKIAQNAACDTFPGSRSYLMKRFKLFFGDVLRHWLLKQDAWLTIFLPQNIFYVQSLHDQDQIWWKVSNFSSETFLEKVDLSKIVNLAWTVLTLARTYQKQIDLLSQDLLFFEDILRKGWFYQDCPLNYEKNWQYKIYWSSGVNWPWMARNPNLIMAWNWRGIFLRPEEVKYKICYDLSWKATNSKHL